MSLLTLERDVEPIAGAFVRSLTAGEQIDLEAATKAAEGNVRKIIAAQLMAYVCDSAGAAVLSVDDAAKVVELRKPSTVRAILEKAGTLNGWDTEAIRGN